MGIGAPKAFFLAITRKWRSDGEPGQNKSVPFFWVGRPVRLLVDDTDVLCGNAERLGVGRPQGDGIRGKQAAQVVERLLKGIRARPNDDALLTKLQKILSP